MILVESSGEPSHLGERDAGNTKRKKRHAKAHLKKKKCFAFFFVIMICLGKPILIPKSGDKDVWTSDF